MAQWEHAGLATQREVVQFEVEAKFVCWWKCEIGLCEIGDERLGRCNIIFSNLKKIQKKNNEKKIWSLTIISRMIAHVPNPGIIPP